MSVKEFMELGLLQEVNRLLLHPMGLALEVTEDLDTGKCHISGVWDYRDDPEGLIFGEDIAKSEAFKEKYKRVEDMFLSKRDERVKNLGWHIQPVEE